MTDEAPRPKRPQEVYTLVVEVGRKQGDGLPKGATGAALMLYASGVDEAEAVREAVAVLKVADLAVLDVTGYGTVAERRANGPDIEADEEELMDRALAENAVIVAQVTPFFPEAPEPAEPKTAARPAPPKPKPKPQTKPGPKPMPRRPGPKPPRG